MNEPVFSMLERGKRGLLDWEAKLILDALGAKWRDLESPSATIKKAQCIL